MESRFGRDFSGVRVHDDSPAARSAAELNALAYTMGREVVFGRGWDAGTTAAGRRLLAHELVHVLQQEGAAPASTAAGQEAGRAGHAVDRSSPSVSRHGPGLQRQPAPGASDCSGWESDRVSLVTAVARHYARTALQPPVGGAIREVKFSRDGLIATAHFDSGLELFVSLHRLPHHIPVTTHGRSNVRGPRCEFGYACPQDGSIVFTTRTCDRHPGNPTPP